MKAVLTRLKKRIRELRAQRARQALSPGRVREAMAQYEQTGELPADRLVAAYLRLLRDFDDFADSSCWLDGDAAGPERHRQAAAKYQQAEQEFRKLEREHGIR